MSAMIPVFAKTIAVGAVVGAGIECLHNLKYQGRYLAVSMVAAAALAAIACLISTYAAIGAFPGIAALSFFLIDKAGRTEMMTGLGATILGGAAGFVVGPALASVNWVLIV